MSSNSSTSSRDGGNTITPSLNSKKQISPAIRWCFTLNNYTDDIISSIVPIFKEFCKIAFYSKEIGESGTPHLQGYLEFKTKKRPLSVFSGICDKFHFEKAKGNLKDNIEYCSKQNDLEVITGNIPKPLKVLKTEDLYPFQKKILDIIKQEPDDRTINWFYEREGNVGKTSFSKYLCVNHNAIYLSGKATDCFYAIQQYIEHNKFAPEIVILDIPRCNIDYTSYLAIEKIKDGIFFSGKYEGGMVVFNPPHILCFSNEKPDMEKLSNDRWKIYKIKNRDI